MKKNFLGMVLIAVLCLIPLWAFGGSLGDAYSSGEEVVAGILPFSVSSKKCPVYADTPLSEVERPNWELLARINLLDFPSGGAAAVRTDNFDIGVIHNLSNQLYAYAWFGNRNTKKTDYEGSAFDPEWKNRMVFGGIGFYFNPIMKVFAGAGKIWANDGDGAEVPLDTAVERGAALDYMLNGYKVEIAYRFIDAAMADAEDAPVSEMTGDGTFSTVSITLVIPFGI